MAASNRSTSPASSSTSTSSSTSAPIYNPRNHYLHRAFEKLREWVNNEIIAGHCTISSLASMMGHETISLWDSATLTRHDNIHVSENIKYIAEHLYITVESSTHLADYPFIMPKIYLEFLYNIQQHALKEKNKLSTSAKKFCKTLLEKIDAVFAAYKNQMTALINGDLTTTTYGLTHHVDLNTMQGMINVCELLTTHGSSSLMSATTLESFQRLIDAGADSNDTLFVTVLRHFDSSQEQFTRFFNHALALGLDINKQYTLESQTLLHYACLIGKPGNIDFLMSLNANPNIFDASGHLPIYHLINSLGSKFENMPLIKKLLEQTNPQLLSFNHIIACLSQTKFKSNCLLANLLINWLLQTHPELASAIIKHMAAHSTQFSWPSDYAIIEKLLDAGAHINQKDAYSNSFLNYTLLFACYINIFTLKPPIDTVLAQITALLSRGASIGYDELTSVLLTDQKDELYNTPVLKLILSQPNAENPHKITDYFSSSDSSESVARIYSLLDIRLAKAIKIKDMELVKLLVAAGANVNGEAIFFTDSQENIPLLIHAMASQDHAIIQYLKDHGATIATHFFARHALQERLTPAARVLLDALNWNDISIFRMYLDASAIHLIDSFIITVIIARAELDKMILILQHYLNTNERVDWFSIISNNSEMNITNAALLLMANRVYLDTPGRFEFSTNHISIIALLLASGWQHKYLLDKNSLITEVLNQWDAFQQLNEAAVPSLMKMTYKAVLTHSILFTPYRECIPDPIRASLETADDFFKTAYDFLRFLYCTLSKETDEENPLYGAETLAKIAAGINTIIAIGRIDLTSEQAAILRIEDNTPCSSSRP